MNAAEEAYYIRRKLGDCRACAVRLGILHGQLRGELFRGEDPQPTLDALDGEIRALERYSFPVQDR